MIVGCVWSFSRKLDRAEPTTHKTYTIDVDDADADADADHLFSGSNRQ
jgi:hypothetical protein